MLVDAQVKSDEMVNSQNTNTVTGGQNDLTKSLRPRHGNRTTIVPLTSPMQLGLGRVHLQTVPCHLMAHVHDALTEMSSGCSYVVTLTVHVKLIE